MSVWAYATTAESCHATTAWADPYTDIIIQDYCTDLFMCLAQTVSVGIRSIYHNPTGAYLVCKCVDEGCNDDQMYFRGVSLFLGKMKSYQIESSLMDTFTN